MNITTEGQRHLGAVLGSKSFKDQYCEEMVDKWTTDLKVLCEIAHTQPQAAYISFTKAFKSKFTYFQRTIPSFEQYLEPLQDVINRTFVPAIIGQDTPLSDQLMACFSLPTSRGGLNIPDLQEETPYQHSSSKLITNVHTESILRQEECMLPCSSSILVELEDGSTTGATPNHLRAQFTSEKVSRLREKIEKVMKDLPEDLRDLVTRHQDRGASFWLEALPLEESDFILSKEVFKDGVRLRYDLPLPDLPSKEEITMGVVYRPPNGSLKQFLLEIEKILIKLPKDHVYLAGDFNINLHDIDENNYASKFDRTILEHGFAPSISLWTHCMPNHRETCIDNIFTNAFESISSSCTILECVSHHLPLICSASSPDYEIGNTGPDNETPQPRYEFNQANCDKLRSSTSNLADVHLSVPVTKTDTFNDLLHGFESRIDETCKVEASSGSKRSQVFKPWITQGIIVASNKKHTFFLDWRVAIKKRSKIKNTEDPEFSRLDLLATKLKSQYDTYRKKLKYIIRHAKRLYNLKKFEEVKGDLKATWKLINKLRGKHKNARIVPSFIIDGELVMNKRIIANAFNKYFVSIASKLNNNDELTVEPLPDFRTFLTKHVSRSIVLEDTNSSEIEEIIQGFANGKASDLPVTAVKQCSRILAPVLTLYFNHFMKEGIFPDILKIGRITPIYKNKGSKQNFNNWRPISILPIFGKIFEKIIYKRLYCFLTSQNLIYSKQFGFRKGHSTSHALNHSVNYLTESVANRNHTIGIFIYLSKAFDTIDHTKLLTKLDTYGIRGTASALIESYISLRKQYTTFDNENSDLEIVVYGVPQGSVLGPLLFLLYINDIVNCSTDGEFVLYADDTNIFVVGPSKSDVFRKANAVIKRVHSYMLSNLLHINTTKCNFMYFKPNIHARNVRARTQPFDQDCKLYLNGSIIKQVSTVKFLGVTIDENLTWLPHLENLKKKLTCSQGVLYRIKDSVPKSLHKTLYHSLFESHLIYGISVWGAQSHTVLHELFTLQKHCIRTLFGNSCLQQKENTYCYCNYGESGTMLCCEKCDKWFHDECLGLAEDEVSNIKIFYCAACEQRYDISTKYVLPPLPSADGKYCHCQKEENGLMIECGTFYFQFLFQQMCFIFLRSMCVFNKVLYFNFQFYL